VILDAVIHNVTSPPAGRQDIAIFVAENGGSAQTGGSCLHDYLEPPLTTSPTYGDPMAIRFRTFHNGDLARMPSRSPICRTTTRTFASGTQAIKDAAVRR